MRLSLENRLSALEAASPVGSNLLLMVGPYAGTSDPAPYVAAARDSWTARYGSPPPEDIREFHIVLVGMKEDASND